MWDDGSLWGGFRFCENAPALAGREHTRLDLALVANSDIMVGHSLVIMYLEQLQYQPCSNGHTWLRRVLVLSPRKMLFIKLGGQAFFIFVFMGYLYTFPTRVNIGSFFSENFWTDPVWEPLFAFCVASVMIEEWQQIIYSINLSHSLEHYFMDRSNRVDLLILIGIMFMTLCRVAGHALTKAASGARLSPVRVP